jgi:hypothetical protein
MNLMPLLTCTECLDTGFRSWDGVPRACPSCDIGRAWETNRRRALDPSTGNSEGRQLLPPGGDVLLAQARRDAVGLPLGAIEEGLPVRGVVPAHVLLATEQAVQEARATAVSLSSAFAACLADLEEGVAVSNVLDRWKPALVDLPEWAEPMMNRSAGRNRTRKATAIAAPLTP